MREEDRKTLVALRRAKDQIDRDYAEPLDVPTLAQTAFMSPAHFARQFKQAFGESPYSYLMTRRVERAMALLRRGDLSVTDVCMAVGCTSLGSFSSRFTELVGETPTAYRNRDHSDLEPLLACVTKVATRPSRNGEASTASSA
jgi:AraC-like DNA-binding protein